MGFSDVKGYYETLGLTPEADTAAVKRAFRLRAKQSHPDAVGLGDTEDFHKLTEAYETLSDADRRADYDAVCVAAATASTKAKPKKKPKPKRDKPRAKPWTKPRAVKPEPPPPEKEEPAAPEPVRCDRCGIISAQLRFARFRRVIGMLTRSRRKLIEGVYCRPCANKLAMRASAVTWLLGWWSLPRGPLDTVRALFHNLAGGDRPVEENARLLARQAHVFAAQGRPTLAGILALQSHQLIPNPALLGLARLAEGRTLKDRWRVGGVAFVIQAFPIGIVIAWLNIHLILWLFQLFGE
ncbi:MAG: J domain-containing protein [Alphaproteobacteria bacterium]|jgi:hypothetical protein|nr:J domain-containing protein [Alphaproteobacteria bacterium]